MLEFFLVELNSKRLLRVQEKKKKVVVLWSRPPQNVKLGIFTSKSYSDDKEGYKTRVHVQSCCFAVLVSLRGRRILGGPNCCQHDAFASKTLARPKKTPALRTTFSLMLPSSLLKLPYYNKMISTTFSKRSFKQFIKTWVLTGTKK